MLENEEVNGTERACIQKRKTGPSQMGKRRRERKDKHFDKGI